MFSNLRTQKKCCKMFFWYFSCRDATVHSLQKSWYLDFQSQFFYVNNVGILTGSSKWNKKKCENHLVQRVLNLWFHQFPLLCLCGFLTDSGLNGSWPVKKKGIINFWKICFSGFFSPCEKCFQNLQKKNHLQFTKIDFTVRYTRQITALVFFCHPYFHWYFYQNT